MDSERARHLVKKYLDGTCTPEERSIIEGWYSKQAQNRADNAEPVDMNRMQESLYARLPQPAPVRKFNSKWLAAAASILIIAGISWYFLSDQLNYTPHTRGTLVNDIAPGKVGATLTLANGKKIKLASIANGELAKQAGVTISKSANGQLVYELKPSVSVNTDLGAVNTLSTANGETYQLRLPDGSMVWLNAASSLTYTANLLKGGKRIVRLSGEGYFEIAKDKKHPFIVETQKQTVEVLGTHFNINSYVNETATRTTLLEGAVKISPFSPPGKDGQSPERAIILKPNQQAILSGPNRLSLLPVTAEDAIAWKDGLFVFEDEPLQEIMRKIARWYNVEVKYEGVDLNERYGGSVSRFDKVSKVLKRLELTGHIHFKIEGRTIIAMK